MTFVRTHIGGDYSCTLGHAEQLNSITHWLDGSMVYGSSLSELNNLRVGEEGLLKYSTTDGKELLPLRPGCSTCYFAGDARALENPQLTIIHTLMMREHNRIARALKKLNPLWDEETLFQETRRIVVAELQHITYNEYLPAMLGILLQKLITNFSRSRVLLSLHSKLIGEQAMEDFKLKPSTVGVQYNEETAVNPSILNEFAAAAFRIGHSQVQGSLVLYDENNQEVTDQSFTLSNSFFNSSMVPQPGFIDNAIRGLTKQVPSSVDVEYTSQLTNLLFKGSNGFGMDLVSLNVQRGREHGIPDYNTVRAFCGLPKAASFEDLSTEIEQQTIDNLKSVYDSVDDIDLYMGCLSESSKPVAGSVLGPTALCIIANQFAIIKNNDRYFYDVTNQISSFSTAQYDEIRKSASMARIMCDNNNGDINTIQPNVFRAPISDNGKQLCSIIPSLNLDMWKDPKATAPSKATVVTPSIILIALFSAKLLL
ncbi:peroxidase-like [Daphnia pulicaria]|uniref:peroxidase-like n=1 Tax=Daphnia pulicaria TaxID=35523 RepID=UPI001EEA89AA|nr:peroxidase-like [Daphnia pulicaria]